MFLALKNKRKWLVLAILTTASLFSLVFFVCKDNKNQILYHLNKSDLDIQYGISQVPVSLVLFFSYDCTFCQKFFTDVFPQLQKEFIDKGIVNLRLKPIALSDNEATLKVLKMVACLSKYGKVDKIHKLLIIQPSAIYSQELNTTIDELAEKDEFVAECMFGEEAENYLSQNILAFKVLKLTGTPTFVINNKIFKGYRGYDELKKIIEKEWKKQIKKTKHTKVF